MSEDNIAHMRMDLAMTFQDAPGISTRQRYPEPSSLVPDHANLETDILTPNVVSNRAGVGRPEFGGRRARN